MHDFENAVNNQEAGSFERNKQTKVLEGGVEEVCVSVCVWWSGWRGICTVLEFLSATRVAAWSPCERLRSESLSSATNGMK